MRRLGPALLLFSLLLALPRAALCQERGARAEVEAAVRALGQAFVAADVTALDALLTDDYVHINGSSGKLLGRAEWLRWVGSRRSEIESGALAITAYEIRELSIHVYGEAAVATGEVYTSGIRDGSTFRSTVRFSNLWVRAGDRWRRAAFHDTPLED